MALAQPASNQGRFVVPPETALLLRKFGLDPDNPSLFFVYRGQNITLEEFCRRTAAEQMEILTAGSVFSV